MSTATCLVHTHFPFSLHLTVFWGQLGTNRLETVSLGPAYQCAHVLLKDTSNFVALLEALCVQAACVVLMLTTLSLDFFSANLCHVTAGLACNATLL